MKQTIIRIENVWKEYEMGKAGILKVLKDITIKINNGEFVIIIGPSGSGKSTLMNLIGTLDKPTRGKIYLEDQNISELSSSSLAHLRGKTIGFIFQQFNLLPNLNALQNVMLPMELIEEDYEAKKRAENLLTHIGLEDRMNHKPNELSGGQQQRVAIARALANDPKIILADEPTGNLDSITGEFIINHLVSLNKKGKTIILITHELELTRYANKIIHIRDGEIYYGGKNENCNTE